MIVRELLCDVNTVRVIARALFEDCCKPENMDGWITKYYAQLAKLRVSKVKKSDMMICMYVVKGERRQYGSVVGFAYADLKKGYEEAYGIEYYNCRKYASIYVPNSTIQMYGEEVVAAEILREYGWNGYDESYKCPENVREEIKREFNEIESGLFMADSKYKDRIKKQFIQWYEGKEVEQHEKDMQDRRMNGVRLGVGQLKR